MKRGAERLLNGDGISEGADRGEETHQPLATGCADLASEAERNPVLDEALQIKRILGAIVASARRNAGTPRKPAP